MDCFSASASQWQWEGEEWIASSSKSWRAITKGERLTRSDIKVLSFRGADRRRRIYFYGLLQRKRFAMTEGVARNDRGVLPRDDKKIKADL